MIVSCPSCSSRYRIRDDKIQGKGARITCPSCQHKFIVHRESEPVGAGGDARGVPVTFARGGQTMRTDFPEEDDESDVPTTVMPHGSQLAQSIRAASEASQALRERTEAAAQHHEAPPSPASPSASDLRSAAKQQDASSGGGLVYVAAGVLLLAVVGAGAAFALGWIPLP